MSRRSSCALLALMLFLAAPAHAQERASPGVAPQKSLVAAAALEYLVPTLGHAYAGDWERGLPPALLLAGGVVWSLSGYSSCVEERGCTQVISGAVLAAAGKLWGLFSAVETAQDQNARGQLRLHPRVSVSVESVRLGWVLPL